MQIQPAINSSLDQLHWCWKCACNMTRPEVLDEHVCGFRGCPLKLKFEHDQHHAHMLDWLCWMGR